MMSIVRRVAVALVVTTLAMTGVAEAQDPAGIAPQTATPQTATRGQRGGTAPLTPAAALNQVQQMLDGEVLIRAQTALQLTDPQWTAFVPKMRELQQLRNQHQRNHARLVQDLNVATKPGANIDEAAIQAKVKALDDLEAQMATDERNAIAAVDSVLTVYQRARFRVMEENVEREKLRLLAKVLASPGSSPQPGPGRGNGGGHERH